MKPEIETERLYLCRITAEDVDDLHRVVYGQDEVMAYLPGREARPLHRVADMVDYYVDHWRRHGFGVWTVWRKTDGELVGDTGLQYVPDSPQIEVFFAFGPAYWGQGLATEAARAALRYGFEQLKLRRIVGLVLPENGASERVLQKIGMRFEKKVVHYNMKLRLYAIADRAFDPGDGLYIQHE